MTTNYEHHLKWKKSEKGREYYLRNKERIDTQRKVWKAANPIRKWLYGVKERARRSNIFYDLEHTDIVVPDVCPVFKMPLDTKSKDWAPSLDRLVPDKGYTKDNVRVISIKANRIKSNATAAELRAIADYIDLNLKPSL